MTVETNGTKTKIIWFLLAIIQTMVGGWVWTVSNKADKVNVLEANYVGLDKKVDGVIVDVKEIRRLVERPSYR